MSHLPFRELLATPGVREVCTLRGRLGFMAYHGGSLEVMTDVIASQAAERSGASYYGVLQPAGHQHHIPSHRVSPLDSAHLRGFLHHVDTVITIHGFGRHGYWTSLLLGGQHRRLAHHVAEHLREGLPDYHVETDLDRIPRELRGLHRDNPVNLPRQRGLQIELPPRGRGQAPHTEALIDALAAASTTWVGASASPPVRVGERRSGSSPA